jgi:hypothetical protein
MAMWHTIKTSPNHEHPIRIFRKGLHAKIFWIVVATLFVFGLCLKF